MSNTIQVRRGANASLPTLNAGELGFSTDTYQTYIGDGAANHELARTEDKNVASGIAGLDSNILLSPAVMYPCLEEYANHLGAVDNFTEVVTTGNGTAVTDVTNHKIDLSTGLSLPGSATFKTKKSWTLSSNAIGVNIIPGSITYGAGGTKTLYIGLSDAFPISSPGNAAIFFVDDAAQWSTITRVGTNTTSNTISSPVVGDILSILATSTKVLFFVNGSVVQTHTVNIPTGGMYIGAMSNSSGSTTARVIGIDLVAMKRYV